MAEAPTLRQLRYFLRAIEMGSFSSAAVAEHVAQPSLSEQIRRLERSLGSQLFTRTNRHLQLTDVGKLLVPLAEQTVRQADHLLEVAREAGTVTGGEVSFGTFSTAYLYLLTPVVAEFRSLHPGVRIRVVGLNSADVADRVRSGELEAGLVQLPIDDRSLQVGPTVMSDEVVYVSADPARATASPDIAALAAAPLILSETHWKQFDPLRRGLVERASAVGLEVIPDVEVEYQAAAIELAAAGVGDTLASRFVIERHLSRHALSWVSIDPPYPERFAFVWRSGGGLSAATQHFIKIASRHMADLRDERGATAPHPSSISEL